jgi:hypothetical protein
LCVWQSWRLLRCSAEGALHPRLSLLGARSALPDPRVVVLDWRHGVGRRSRTTRTPWGSPRRGSRTCHDSPRRCSGLSNTSDTRLRCASPTKRGRKTQGMPKTKNEKRQRNTPKRYATPGCKSLTIGFCRNESLGGQGRVRRALSSSHSARADRCKDELQLASQCSPVLTRAEDTRVSRGGLRARQGNPAKKTMAGRPIGRP